VLTVDALLLNAKIVLLQKTVLTVLGKSVAAGQLLTQTRLFCFLLDFDWIYVKQLVNYKIDKTKTSQY